MLFPMDLFLRQQKPPLKMTDRADERFALDRVALIKHAAVFYATDSQVIRTDVNATLAYDDWKDDVGGYCDIMSAAIERNDAKLVELLLSVTDNHLAECGAEQCPYMLPAQHAIQANRGRIAKIIIDAMRNVDLVCPLGNSTLHSAVFHKNAAIFKLLVKRGARLDYVASGDFRDTTVSLFNATNMHTKDTFFTLLIQAGAPVPRLADLWTDNQRKLLTVALKKHEWNVLIDTALLLFSMNLPVLVMYNVYLKLPLAANCGPKIAMHKAWPIIRKIKVGRDETHSLA